MSARERAAQALRVATRDPESLLLIIESTGARIVEPEVEREHRQRADDVLARVGIDGQAALKAAGELRDIVAHINGGLVRCSDDQRTAIVRAAEILEAPEGVGWDWYAEQQGPLS